MASSDTLREQVASAVRENSPCPIVMGAWPERTADAAIRVVLAAVTEQVDALDVAEQARGRYFGGESQRVLREVRARVARLGEAVSDGE